MATDSMVLNNGLYPEDPSGNPGCFPPFLARLIKNLTEYESKEDESKEDESEEDESKEAKNELVGVFTVKIGYFLNEYGEKQCTLVNLCKDFYNNENRSIEGINYFLKELTNDINSDSEKDKDFPSMITALFNGINSLNTIHFGDNNMDINISLALPKISEGIKELYESVIKFLLNKKYDKEFFKNGGKFKFGNILIDSRSKYRLMKYFLRKRKGNLPENISNLPENISNSPEDISNSPKNIPDSPENIPDLPEYLGFKISGFSNRIEKLLEGLFYKGIEAKINLINRSFYKRLNKHKGENSYIVGFLDKIKSGKLNEIKTYIDNLMNEIDNSEHKKDIIKFYKIVNGIIEDLGNEDEYNSKIDGYTGNLEDESNGRSMDRDINSRTYKSSIVYQISKYIKHLGNKIDADQNLKQESLEIDIENIVNDFSSNINELKKNSLFILNDFPKGNNTNSSDVSKNDNDLVKIFISNIQTYIRNINNDDAIFDIPQKESKKHKDQLKKLFEVFVDTYNQIIEKIGSTYDNPDIYKDKLNNLHDTVIKFINKLHHYSTDNYKHEFMNMKTGKLNPISKNDILLIISYYFL